MWGSTPELQGRVAIYPILEYRRASVAKKAFDDRT